MYTLNNDVFRGLVLYGGGSLVKLALMSPMTGVFRRMNKSFSNPEDAKFAGGARDIERITEMTKPNSDVERVRWGWEGWEGWGVRGGQEGEQLKLFLNCSFKISVSIRLQINKILCKTQ